MVSKVSFTVLSEINKLLAGSCRLRRNLRERVCSKIIQSQNVQLQQPCISFYCLPLKCVILTSAREEIKGSSRALKALQKP